MSSPFLDLLLNATQFGLLEDAAVLMDDETAGAFRFYGGAARLLRDFRCHSVHLLAEAPDLRPRRKCAFLVHDVLDEVGDRVRRCVQRSAGGKLATVVVISCMSDAAHAALAGQGSEGLSFYGALRSDIAAMLGLSESAVSVRHLPLHAVALQLPAAVGPGFAGGTNRLHEFLLPGPGPAPFPHLVSSEAASEEDAAPEALSERIGAVSADSLSPGARLALKSLSHRLAEAVVHQLGVDASRRSFSVGETAALVASNAAEIMGDAVDAAMGASEEPLVYRAALRPLRRGTLIVVDRTADGFSAATLADSAAQRILEVLHSDGLADASLAAPFSTDEEMEFVRAAKPSDAAAPEKGAGAMVAPTFRSLPKTPLPRAQLLHAGDSKDAQRARFALALMLRRPEADAHKQLLQLLQRTCAPGKQSAAADAKSRADPRAGARRVGPGAELLQALQRFGGGGGDAAAHRRLLSVCMMAVEGRARSSARSGAGLSYVTSENIQTIAERVRHTGASNLFVEEVKALQRHQDAVLQSLADDAIAPDVLAQQAAELLLQRKADILQRRAERRLPFRSLALLLLRACCASQRGSPVSLSALEAFAAALLDLLLPREMCAPRCNAQVLAMLRGESMLLAEEMRGAALSRDLADLLVAKLRCSPSSDYDGLFAAARPLVAAQLRERLVLRLLEVSLTSARARQGGPAPGGALLPSILRHVAEQNHRPLPCLAHASGAGAAASAVAAGLGMLASGLGALGGLVRTAADAVESGVPRPLDAEAVGWSFDEEGAPEERSGVVVLFVLGGISCEEMKDVAEALEADEMLRAAIAGADGAPDRLEVYLGSTHVATTASVYGSVFRHAEEPEGDAAEERGAEEDEWGWGDD